MTGPHRDSGSPPQAGSLAYRRLQDETVHARRLRAAGDYRSAAERLRRAIADAETVLGADAIELVVPLNELGMVDKFSGNFAEAEEVYRRALLIHGGRGGSDAAAILHNLGGLAHARGDAEAAELLARRGIAVRLSLDDVDPLAVAADRAALAAILIDLGRLSEARAMLTAVLLTYENDPVPHRYEIATTLHNLGSLQFRESAFSAAEATLRRAYTCKKAILGRRHPDLAITLHNLARCQRELGRPRATRRHLKRAIGVLVGAVADSNPTLAACRQQLASMYTLRG